MAKGQSGDGSKAEALTVLDEVRVAREVAEAVEREAVLTAREAGVSWSRIGELYGLTKQGAQQRFKPGVKRARAEAGD